MSNTTDNLKVAFSGESQANLRYHIFAKKAEKDGFPNIAKLFRTTAEAERIHAEGHLHAMDEIGSTLENLEKAIKGETYEYTEMYPPMFRQAEKENHKAKRMFKYALEVEEIHAKLYKFALESVRKGKDITGEIYLCPVCGHIEIASIPEKCPVCGVKRSMYIQL
jgi:rubrerythrin